MSLAWRVLVSCGLGLLPTLAGAGELTLRSGPATLVLTTPGGTGTQLEMRLVDRMQLLLHVEQLMPFEVEWQPRFPAVWQVSAAPPEQGVKEGRHFWRQTLQVELVADGSHTLQLPPLRYRREHGAWENVNLPSAALKITKSLRKVDLKVLRPPPPIEELPPPSETALSAFWLWLLGGVLAGMALLSVCLILLLRRGSAAGPVSPEQEALRALDRLGQQLPTTAVELRDWHSVLMNILRRYAHRRWQLPAIERTSAELCAALQPAVTEEVSKAFAELCERCDRAKFIPITPSADDCQRTLELANSLLSLAAIANP